MGTNDPIEVGKRVDSVRKKLKFKSVRSFAKAADVDDSLLSKIIKGEKPLTEGVLINLNKNLHINSTWLESGVGSELVQERIESQEDKEVDYKKNYYVLLEKYNEKLLEYNECLKKSSESLHLNSAELRQVVEVNQRLISELYQALNLPLPHVGKDTHLSARKRGKQ